MRTHNFSLPKGKGELTPEAVCNSILKIMLQKSYHISITIALFATAFVYTTNVTTFSMMKSPTLNDKV